MTMTTDLCQSPAEKAMSLAREAVAAIDDAGKVLSTVGDEPLTTDHEDQLLAAGLMGVGKALSAIALSLAVLAGRPTVSTVR